LKMKLKSFNIAFIFDLTGTSYYQEGCITRSLEKVSVLK
jgi:hypothetical protein